MDIRGVNWLLAPTSPMSATTFHVPKRRHPELIGKGGANLRDLQTKFAVKISVPGREETSNEVVVSGKPDDVEAVREEIEKLLNIRTRNPTTSWKLEIHPDNFKILIGRGGATLRGLESKYGVSIAVPKRESSDQDVVVEGVEADLEELVFEIGKLLATEVNVKRPKPPTSPSSAKSPAAAKPPAVGGKSSAAPSTSSVASPAPAQSKETVAATPGSINKVIFFPDKDPVHTPNIHEFLSYLGSAKSTLEICVFTITDDRIAAAIIKSAAHGVKVRVITDDDQSAQLGSDIQKLRDAGIPVKMDVSPFHMHHKFAVIDRALLLNGSFNWTKGASSNNCENIMITNNNEFVKAFETHFEGMWSDAQHFK